ncbi:MAG: hypothetical protein HS128_22185 [Ideonella sp.]|nr:hypothetical protein [Ideonella sp.]MCC7457178.1 hypothetical protein [Nitrospira sp.]
MVSIRQLLDTATLVATTLAAGSDAAQKKKGVTFAPFAPTRIGSRAQSSS